MAADETPQLATEPEARAAEDAQSDSQLSVGSKRKADTELEETGEVKKMKQLEDEETEQGDYIELIINDGTNGEGKEAGGEQKKLSKKARKRQARQEKYESYKEERKEKRKEKRHEKQAKKRAERETKIAEAVAAGLDPAEVLKPTPKEQYRVPITFMIDCDFEKYMRDPEIVSLSSQITRSYSENRKAKYQANLWVTSWGGKLRERFDSVLKGQWQNWTNAYFTSTNFKTATALARNYMGSGKVIDLIKPDKELPRAIKVGEGETSPGQKELIPEPEFADDVAQDVIYLTSESPYTLDRLEANKIYVIGGIVDRNREKGLCYKRAQEYKVRTAKLPIGEYMRMNSRYVLTTNQVVEIMARWLECGDWGEAFLSIIPKRKGGRLKSEGGSEATPSVQGEDDKGYDDNEPESEQNVAEEATGVKAKEDVTMQNPA